MTVVVVVVVASLVSFCTFADFPTSVFGIYELSLVSYSRN